MDEVIVQSLEPILPNSEIESLVICDDRVSALESLVMELGSCANFVRI